MKLGDTVRNSRYPGKTYKVLETRDLHGHTIVSDSAGNEYSFDPLYLTVIDEEPIALCLCEPNATPIRIPGRNLKPHFVCRHCGDVMGEAR